MRNYKNLDAWKAGMELVRQSYQIVRTFSSQEFSLASQIKRAAVSVPANIAEGMGRNYKKDSIQFLYIARGSVYELETLLNIAIMVNIINRVQVDELTSLFDDSLRLLNGLINYMEKANLK